jgi:triosephosphate isomerase
MSKPRGVLIAGNWKMNHGQAETEAFFASLGALPKAKGLDVALFPPATSLGLAVARAKLSGVHIGAQNLHWERSGAFTGELSAAHLLEIGVRYALVAHSERRQYFGETDESARRRVEGAILNGMRPILCVGETRAEREAGQTASVLLRQLKGALPDSSARAYLDGRLVIAYEPVWAIGTGLTAKPEQAEEAHQIIRKDLWDRFGLEAAGKTQILYGGSVTPANVEALLSCANIDGALVGGASLKADSFRALVTAGAKAQEGREALR